MFTFLQLLASGLALGAVYALVALGFVVVYRASQVFNFAHGELLTFGAFMMVSFSGMGLPWVLALLLAVISTGLLSAGMERVFLRRMVGRPVFVTIILTIFLGLILRTAIMATWGTDVRGMPTAWDTSGVLRLGEASILWNSIAAIVASGVALAGFFAMIKFTRLGIAMRATSSDQEVALALGIPVGRIFGVTWFVAGGLAALGGIFLGMFPRQLDPTLGYIALRAFPAVIVGGLESPGGAVIAGFLLGVLEVMSQAYLNQHLGAFGHNFHAVFPYVVMILFLIVRPYGMFGARDVERV